MGISIPEKDLLGRDLKEGGIMTSALKRSISPQEVSYGIKLILQAVPNNHSIKEISIYLILNMDMMVRLYIPQVLFIIQRIVVVN